MPTGTWRTRLLHQTRSLLTGAAEMRVEGRNSFKYRHASGAILAGKPDLLALGDGDALVLDCKTGRPKTSDRVQVQIYMAALPFCFPELGGRIVRGRVVYPTHAVDIPPDAVEEGFRDDLDYFVDLLASETPPAPSPSTRECLFCDITPHDCRSRVGPQPLGQAL